MAKPKTKLENRVWDLSKKLPALTKNQELYGNDMTFWKYFTVCRNRLYCLECGHKWKGNVDLKLHKCPNCSKQLRPLHNEAWMKAQGYYMVMTRVKEFQVLRYFYMVKWMRKESEPKYESFESSQIWIKPNGHYTIMGADRNPFGAYYGPQWKKESELSIKRENYFYNNHYTPYHSACYPSKNIIPELKRNGFKSGFYGLNPGEMIVTLLSNPKAETLFKRGNMVMFREAVQYPHHIDNYWDEIKIAFRNNYKIEDYGIWKDYIDMLRTYNKDTHNPVYVCPDDLNAAHDKYMRKQQREVEIAARQRREEAAQKAREKVGKWKEKYPEMRKAFADFNITNGSISIEVICSVEQLEEESTLLAHCAFVNGYYARKNSLLLSARINGIVTETIEINLKRMQIVQARGFKNKATEYNPEIVQLVKDNLPKIRKLHKKQLKLSA